MSNYSDFLIVFVRNNEDLRLSVNSWLRTKDKKCVCDYSNIIKSKIVIIQQKLGIPSQAKKKIWKISQQNLYVLTVFSRKWMDLSISRMHFNSHLKQDHLVELWAYRVSIWSKLIKTKNCKEVIKNRGLWENTHRMPISRQTRYPRMDFMEEIRKQKSNRVYRRKCRLPRKFWTKIQAKSPNSKIFWIWWTCEKRRLSNFSKDYC